MNIFVKRIVLFSAQGEKREVALEQGLNIITGDSKTGKSALIEIVDYCLFSSRSSIPVGKITQFAELFCIVLQAETKFLVIARPAWQNKADRNKAYFSFEATPSFLNDLSLDYFMRVTLRNLKDVQEEVERHLGLAVSDTRESDDEDKRNFGKVTLRSFVSLLFQHQNLIANKHSLFYRFDDYQKRKKTIEQMPILLGWVDADYYSLLQQINDKKRLLKREQDRIRNLTSSKDVLAEKLRQCITPYYQSIGYELEATLPLNELKKIAKNLPELPLTVEEDSNVARQLEQLHNENRLLKESLSETEAVISHIEQNHAQANSYQKKLQQLVANTSVEKNISNLNCPVCHQATQNVEHAVIELTENRHALINELKQVGEYRLDSSQHMRELIQQRDEYKAKIRRKTEEIRNLEATIDIQRQYRSTREGLMFLRGRIEATLSYVMEQPILLAPEVDIDELANDIKNLQDEIDEYGLKSKRNQANAFICKRMTDISKTLDFETELQPGEMNFDLESFDFWYWYEGKRVLLSEMGSGANWLACHLSLFLSLLHLNCKENKSSIPSFLFIDQPSQVYFPRATHILNIQEKDELNNEVSYDENIKQVKNIFTVILNELKKIKDDCGFMPQVVVMEHADEEELKPYVKKRWVADGEKLI